MDNRRKILIALFLLVGILVIVFAAVEKVEAGYPGGLASLIAGAVFWILAND